MKSTEKPEPVHLYSVVREYFPHADDNDAEHILWNNTPYPMGGVVDIRRMLKIMADTLRAGGQPCMGCNKAALVSGFCEACFGSAGECRDLVNGDVDGLRESDFRD